MSNETYIEILKALSDAPGTSGDEIEVRRRVRPYLEGHVDALHVDHMGNLVTLKKGTGANPLRVLVTAHTDEVGFMVMDHTGDGDLKIDTVGGIDPRLAPGLEVRVGSEGLPGVIGLEAIHRAKSIDAVTPFANLTVDIGASSKEEAAKLAPIGTRITFATRAQQLGNLIAGKAFDDRAGCTVLTALLMGPPFPCDLYGVYTVQEEVGLRGARVAGYATAPDAAFALEGTIADDLPKDEDVSPTSVLGKGPVITVMDRSYVAATSLLKHVVQTAQHEMIPFQFKQPGIGGTDAGAIHFTRGGVPSITIAVPCRYIHGPIALLNPQDLAHTIALLRAALEGLTPEILHLA
ncbi:MAG: M42 family peptidase [Anaerolineae bacterium]|nr:M42 family peptidase [Anaerolineae bacterium]